MAPFDRIPGLPVLLTSLVDRHMGWMVIFLLIPVVYNRTWYYLISQDARASLVRLAEWQKTVAGNLDGFSLKERRDILIVLKASVLLYDSDHTPRMELSIELPLSGIMPVTEEEDQVCVLTPFGVIPIGHPAPDKRSPSLKRGRKAQGEYVHREQW